MARPHELRGGVRRNREKGETELDLMYTEQGELDD